MDIKNRLFPKRLLIQENHELGNSYNRTRVKGYIEFGLGFLVFLVVANIIMDLYDLISSVSPEIGFQISQSIIVVMLITTVLVAVDFSLCSRMRKLERNQIDLMCQLRTMENDMEIMNRLAERLNLIDKNEEEKGDG